VAAAPDVDALAPLEALTTLYERRERARAANGNQGIDMLTGRTAWQ